MWTFPYMRSEDFYGNLYTILTYAHCAATQVKTYPCNVFNIIYYIKY